MGGQSRSSLITTFFIIAFGILQVNAAQTETFDVRTAITARFAETVISSRVKNERDSSQEITFQVLLPKEAFISGFSMVIGDKTYDAVAQEKEKAEKAFQAAKEQNKTAGLVATRSESSKAFKTSVNIEAGETVEFRLVHQQLLRRIRGKFRNQVILLGSQLTDILTIEVDICETETIKSIAVPPILDSEGNSVTVQTIIDRQNNSARVEYLQGDNDEVVSALASSGGSFVVEYELETTQDAGEIILNNGFFAYFFAPEIAIQARRVVFTLDVSGSMFGQKIAQLKEAMTNIISKLTEEDRFTILTFSQSVNAWKENILVPGTSENIESAKQFITAMRASGGTNIDEALRTALRILTADVGDAEVDPQSNYVVFLTDGQPTAGETSVSRILDNIDNENTKKFAIHAMGFGERVDSGFLKALAARSRGSWTQILTDINAALQIQNYLDEIRSPFLQDIVIDYPRDIVDEFIVTNPESFVGGEELTIIGRLKDSIDPRNRGPHTIQITGQSGGNVLVEAQFDLDEGPPVCPAVRGTVVEDFGRKSFALTDVAETLRLYHAEKDDEEKERLRELAVNKSIEAGLVTPVTALLIIKPDDLKKSMKTPHKRPRPREQLHRSMPSWQFNGDPHFIVHLTRSMSACFNWFGQNGQIVNFLSDHNKGIIINGLVNGPPEEIDHAVFVIKLAIILRKENLAIIINTKEATIRNTTTANKLERDLRLPMVDIVGFKSTYGTVTLRINDIPGSHTVLNVTISGGVSFIINVYHPPDHKTKYMDIMISGSEWLSKDVGGIFGQFPRKLEDDDAEFASIKVVGSETYLWYRDEVIPTSKRTKLVPFNETVPCWFIEQPSTVLGSSLDAFNVETLFPLPTKTKS